MIYLLLIKFLRVHDCSPVVSCVPRNNGVSSEINAACQQNPIKHRISGGRTVGCELRSTIHKQHWLEVLRGIIEEFLATVAFFCSVNQHLHHNNLLEEFVLYNVRGPQGDFYITVQYTNKCKPPLLRAYVLVKKESL